MRTGDMRRSQADPATPDQIPATDPGQKVPAAVHLKVLCRQAF
jgi:hypothetical protein